MAVPRLIIKLILKIDANFYLKLAELLSLVVLLNVFGFANINNNKNNREISGEAK